MSILFPSASSALVHSIRNLNKRLVAAAAQIRCLHIAIASTHERYKRAVQYQKQSFAYVLFYRLDVLRAVRELYRQILNNLNDKLIREKAVLQNTYGVEWTPALQFESDEGTNYDSDESEVPFDDEPFP